MQPLWARVDQNRVKLTVFVVAFVAGSAALLTLALVGVPGAMIGWGGTMIDEWTWAWYAPRLAAAVAIAFGVALAGGSLLSAVQLANAEDWVRARFKGTDLDPAMAGGLAEAVTDMSLAAGLGAPPRLVMIDAPGVNAFALGTSRSQPLIGVTPSFLQTLSADEQRAVAAALVARIISGDIMFATALAALMGPLKAIRDSRHGIAGMADATADGCAVTDPGCTDGCGRGCSGDGCLDGLDVDDAGGCGMVIAVVVFIAVTIALTYAAVVTAAWIVTLWGRVLHRTAYEKADAEGMLLLKDPAPMLSALKSAMETTNEVGTDDPSYDGIFYAAPSGRKGIDARERRRFDRLREVLGVDGIAARAE